jgi:hypothetical protein
MLFVKSKRTVMMQVLFWYNLVTPVPSVSFQFLI